MLGACTWIDNVEDQDYGSQPCTRHGDSAARLVFFLHDVDICLWSDLEGVHRYVSEDKRGKCVVGRNQKQAVEDRAGMQEERLETVAKTRPLWPHVHGYESKPGARVRWRC